MSRRKKRAIQTQMARLQPVVQAEHIPANDRHVLKEQLGLPLERGGIYSEMGADMTYEELISYPSTGKAFTHFESKAEQKADLIVLGLLELLGITFMLLGLFIIFFSPFWFSAITLGITLIAKRYHSNFIFIAGICFTVISFLFAVYSLLY